jgi:hypothetical protein
MVCYNSLLVLFLQQKGITLRCRGTLAFNAMFGTTTCKIKMLFLKQKSLLLPWEKTLSFTPPSPLCFLYQEEAKSLLPWRQLGALFSQLRRTDSCA